MVGGLRPSTFRGAGAVHHPVALLFALKRPWRVVQFRTCTGPVSLKATQKTWSGRCLGFSLALGVRCQRPLSKGCANIWNLALSLLSVSAFCCSAQ
jgi:hypothetical protein